MLLAIETSFPTWCMGPSRQPFFFETVPKSSKEADVAILVVDVSHFEAGFDRGGQTKEHAQLARALREMPRFHLSKEKKR